MYFLQVHLLALVLEKLEAWRPLLEKERFCRQVVKWELDVSLLLYFCKVSFYCQIF